MSSRRIGRNRRPNNKGLADLIEKAEEMGYEAIGTRSHWKFLHPEVPRPIFHSSTPSEYRASLNCLKQLQRELRLAREAAANSA